MLKKDNIFNMGCLIILFILVFSSQLFAEIYEYKDYTIQKGDTLWDISREELNDPFLWPKVWKENPEIQNPDKIYPNQKIKIPLNIIQKEIIKPEPEIKAVKKPEIPEKPEPKIIQPLEKEYLVDKKLLISSGYIADSVESVGEIIETPTGRTIIAKGDYAYIRTKKPINVGDKFYIIKPLEKVKHPATARKLGYLIDVRGIAEVVNEDDPKIVITDSYWEISIGDLLDAYYEIEPPLDIEDPRKPDINGYIVATKHLHLINIPYDVAYIDRGWKHGLEVGDLLATTLQSKHKIVNGLVQVINLKEATATVIVRKSDFEVSKGDGITAVTQE